LQKIKKPNIIVKTQQYPVCGQFLKFTDGNSPLFWIAESI